MLNGLRVTNLTKFQFQQNADQPMNVVYQFTGSPIFDLEQSVPDDIHSPNSYPIKVHVGETILVTFRNRPLSKLKEILVGLEVNASKPIIRLVMAWDPPEELVDALVKSGVEVVLDHASV